jgi:hypothetical protein
MLRVMSRRGDDRFIWPDLKRDSNFLELAHEQKRAVEEAERIFAEERRKGATAFLVEAGKPPQRIDEFDPYAKEMILVPRVIGG